MAVVPGDLPPVNNQQTTQVTVTQVQGNFDQIETNLETLRALLSVVNAEVGGGGAKVDEVFIGDLFSINPVGTLMDGRQSDVSVLLRDIPSGAQLRIRGQSITPAGSIEELVAPVAATEGLNVSVIPFTSSVDSSAEGNEYDVLFDVILPGVTTPLVTFAYRLLFSNFANLTNVTYYGTSTEISAPALDLTTFDTQPRFNGLFGIPSINSPVYLWILYPEAERHPTDIRIGGLSTGGTDQLEHFFLQTGVRTINSVSYSAARTQRLLTPGGDFGGRQFTVNRRTF